MYGKTLAQTGLGLAVVTPLGFTAPLLAIAAVVLIIGGGLALRLHRKATGGR